MPVIADFKWAIIIFGLICTKLLFNTYIIELRNCNTRHHKRYVNLPWAKSRSRRGF